ncbi:MAG: hypothetical protein HY326_05435, partial [Chloroflexi bacterium]|nr:hypothetical protein [Chloroflexota bacterium]
YGIDPRTLSEFDKRWTDYQAEIITPFVEAVKSRLKPSMRLSVIIPGNKFDTTRWGLDVETWVREGIVDDIYVLGQRFNKLDYHADAPDALDLEYFHYMPGRERIRLFAASAPRPMFFQHYPEWRQLMESFLARGADGFCMWDGAGYIDKVGDIGLAQPADIFDHRLPPRERKINTLSGLRIDRYHPIEGF